MRLSVVFGLIFAALFPAAGWAYPDAAVGSVSLTVQPIAIVLGNTGRFLYAADGASGAVAVVDTLFFAQTTRTSISGTPKYLAVSNDGTSLYVVTGASDAITKLSLEDPSSPSDLESLDIGTSGVVFDRIQIAGSSGQDRLILMSKSAQKIYIFDVASGELVTNGSVDHSDIGFEPVGFALTPDKLRVATLSNGGQFKAFLVSSFSQVGSTMDFGPHTTSTNFTHLHVNTTGTTVYGFATNNVSPGEIFLVNMSGGSNLLSLVDADTSTAGTTDPITVGDEPSASLVSTIQRADGGDATAVYHFAANQNDSTISVTKMSAIGGGSAVAPFKTIEDVPNVPSLGMVISTPEEGYLFAADQSGSALTVISDQPFIEVTSSPTDPVESSAEFTLTSTQAGTLSAYHYTGDTTEAVSRSNGTILKSISIDEDTETNLSIPVDGLEEGENTIAFFLQNGDFLGRTAVTVTKDTPPPTPKDFKVGFGNQKVVAQWDRVSATDMSHYLVYFGTSSSAEGGVPSLSSPQRVDQPSSGDLKFAVEPVDNGTTVYIKVIAVDEGGKESEPTETLSDTAEETIGLLGLSGEHGGCGSQRFDGTCLGIISLLLLFLRKKKTSALLCFVFFLIGPASLQAQDKNIVKDVPSQTPRTSLEFRVGWWVPSSDAVRTFYGKGGNEQYSLRFGVLIGNLDLGFEGGLLSEGSWLKGVTSGRNSVDSGRLTLVPIEFSGQYNFEFLNPQFAVPFVRAGYDLTWFKISEPTQSESGGKHMLALTGGLRLNLEQMGFGNDLEDLLGIRHFFLEAVVTYRYQLTGGVDLGGMIYGPGLGVDF
jgi:hypothetical protein